MRYLETDSNTNKDISSAVSIGAYTADADRLILCDVSIDQAAGSGDYVMYITRQINGSGSAYVILPKTTMTAAAGETAIGGQSGFICVRTGDVLTVYVDGLAGDTSTPDTTVRWFELAALRPTTADRTLDVSAGGEAGIDWANVGSPATALDLSATKVKTATDVETDTADIQSRIPAALVSGRIDANVGAMAANSLTAAAIAADAAAELADAVWDEALSGHVAAGSAGAMLSAAGGASDPLLNTVPGSYVSGTAGNALGRIGTGRISTVSPVAQDGDIEIYVGDDYDTDEGRSLDWTDDDGTAWPTLTGASIAVKIQGVGIYTGSVVTATGAGKKVRLELTAAQTGVMPIGSHAIQVIATLAAPTNRVATLVDAVATIKRRVTV